MDITKADIEEFQRIWREEFKEEISEDEARKKIGQLDELYLMLARSSSKNVQGSDPNLSIGRHSSNPEPLDTSGIA